MAKRSPRLIFTEEERALPELERAVRKADRAGVKLEKAEAKIPRKTVKVRERVVDSESGKVTTRLFFEEADKKRPPSKLAHAARKAPPDTVRSAVHRKLREEGDDNPGTEAANTLTETAERTWRIAESAHRSHAEKPYRKADKAEAAADKANLKSLNKQYEQEYGRASNPYSRWRQKQAIKKEYAAAKAGNGARNTVKASETTAKAARRAAEGSKELGSFFVRHKKVSFRDGHYYVFDGQHTIVARKHMNGNNDLPILCKVYYGMTEAEEALLFAMQTGYSAALTPSARLRANLRGEDKASGEFYAATEEAGLHVGFERGSGTGRILCINTAFAEFRRAGAELYKEALTILLEAWGGDPDSLRAEVIQGIVHFVELYHGEYDRERLIYGLRAYEPKFVYAAGKAEKELRGIKRYVNLFYRIYNGRRRHSTLPMKF